MPYFLCVILNRTLRYTNFRGGNDTRAICLSLEIACIDGETPHVW